jgi:hypothetical protein
MAPIISRIGTSNFGFFKRRSGFPRVLTSGTISGSTTVGSTLTYTLATFAGDPTPTVTYIWYSGVTQVASNVTTYTVQNSDQGNTITVIATARNSFGSVSTTSNGIAIPIIYATFQVELWGGDGAFGWISPGVPGGGGIGGIGAQGGYAKYNLVAPTNASMKFYVGDGGQTNQNPGGNGYNRGGNSSSIGPEAGGGGGGNSSGMEYALSPTSPYTWLAVAGGGGGSGVDLSGNTYNNGGRGNGYGSGETASGSGGSQGSPTGGGSGVQSSPTGPQLSGGGGAGASGGNAGTGAGGGGGGAGNSNPAVNLGPGASISLVTSSLGSPNNPAAPSRTPTSNVEGRIIITTEPGSTISLDSGTPSYTYPVSSFK